VITGGSCAGSGAWAGAPVQVHWPAGP